jgi:hypothetical protein
MQASRLPTISSTHQEIAVSSKNACGSEIVVDSINELEMLRRDRLLGRSTMRIKIERVSKGSACHPSEDGK